MNYVCAYFKQIQWSARDGNRRAVSTKGMLFETLLRHCTLHFSMSIIHIHSLINIHMKCVRQNNRNGSEFFPVDGGAGERFNCRSGEAVENIRAKRVIIETYVIFWCWRNTMVLSIILTEVKNSEQAQSRPFFSVKIYIKAEAELNSILNLSVGRKSLKTLFFIIYSFQRSGFPALHQLYSPWHISSIAFQFNYGPSLYYPSPNAGSAVPFPFIVFDLRSSNIFSTRLRVIS